MKTPIKDEWDKVLAGPKAAKFAPEMREAMELMFYTGAGTLFFLIINQMTEGEEPQEQDMEMMDAINNELAFFKDRVLVKAAQYRAEQGEKSGQATTGS